MSAIYVCPLSRLAETVDETKAEHVVTLISEGTDVERPARVEAGNHLFLSMHDISDPADGLVLPSADHVNAFLTFVHGWERMAPVVIHCFAGISRSTAAAFSAYCAIRPDVDETEIAMRIRVRSPEATPNARIVQLADEILGRNGRMVEAVERIGRGVFAQEGTVFALHLHE